MFNYIFSERMKSPSCTVTYTQNDFNETHSVQSIPCSKIADLEKCLYGIRDKLGENLVLERISRLRDVKIEISDPTNPEGFKTVDKDLRGRNVDYNLGALGSTHVVIQLHGLVGAGPVEAITKTAYETFFPPLNK